MTWFVFWPLHCKRAVEVVRLKSEPTMVTAILSRVIIVVCGILYPAYSSFKAVRKKSHRDYTKWMMYWIVFALFQAVETLTDTFLAWLPLYYELKIVFVLWLALPITEGAKQLYRIIVHPFLLKHEDQIDEYITKAGHTGLDAIRRVSREGINRAATTVVSSAMKGQAVITETLLRAQEGGQNHTDNGESQINSTEYRSSTDSEPFEVIQEEEENITEDADTEQEPAPHDYQANAGQQPIASNYASNGDHYTEGLYKRAY